MPDVVVVGSGIAGLGAARELVSRGLDVLVLEREGEAGGRMRSRQVWDGAWIDRGAEQLTSADTAFEEIIEASGLGDQKIGYLSETGTAFPIQKGGRTYELDIARPHELLTYGAISPSGRARLALLLPAMIRQTMRNRGNTFESWRAAPVDDQSVEEWLGRLAPEFLEYAMEPLWEVVCGWPPDEISRGFLLHTMTAYRSATGFTLSTGVGAVTRALASTLDVQTDSRVTRVDVTERLVTFDDPVTGRPVSLRPDAVVVALPGHVVRDVVDGLGPARERFFASVRYQPGDNCFFRLRDDAEPSLGDRGFWPRKEHGTLSSLGITPLPTDPERRVLRAGLKSALTKQLVGCTDDELEAAIMARVSEVAPDVPALVEDRCFNRWEAALPIFYPGYLRALAGFFALPPEPGVAFAGDYLAMPATGAAHHSGLRAAEQVAAHLGGTR